MLDAALAVLGRADRGDARREGHARSSSARALRKATIELKCTPVMMGSALGNKARPAPARRRVLVPARAARRREHRARPRQGRRAGRARVGPDEAARHARVQARGRSLRPADVHPRSIRARFSKDEFIVNSRNGKKVKVGRLVRMHSDDMEEITDAGAGDICALFGVDCNSGDTFTDGTVNYAMTSMFVPTPVISVAVKPKDYRRQINMSKALQPLHARKIRRSACHVDPEIGETIIAGMGELHLDVYIERMKREYKAEVVTSPPQVAYRETITQQDRVQLHAQEADRWLGSVRQGRRLLRAVRRRLRVRRRDQGRLDSARVHLRRREGLQVDDRRSRRASACRSSASASPSTTARRTRSTRRDIAFQEAARGALREFFPRAAPKILEPIMKVSIEGPAEFSGNILGLIMQRRGIVIGSTEEDGNARVDAEVPLSEMFGFSTPLRSARPRARPSSRWSSRSTPRRRRTSAKSC